MNDYQNSLRLCLIATLLCSCMMPSPAVERAVPAIEYSNKVRNEHSRTDTDDSFRTSQQHFQSPDARSVSVSELRSPYPPDQRGVNTRTRSPRQDAYGQIQAGPNHGGAHSRAQLRYVDQERGQLEYFGDTPEFAREGIGEGSDEVVSNLNGAGQNMGYQVYRSSQQTQAPYRGPLTLGDPGATSSLWQESRGRNELFRDFRAFQPMDVITILVEENSEGSKEADTEVSEEADVLAGITNFFNFENDVEASNSGLDTASLIQANAQNDFSGEGETTRRGSLKGKISAMVVEILPSGVMRIEGERIISVNSEEQVMIISGLVRPQDVNSTNEVMSGSIANLRVDYYGKGVVGEAQDGGWMSRIMRKLWPF